MGIRELLLGDRRDPRRVLDDLLGGTSTSGSPSDEARSWAHAHLARAGIDPAKDPMQAVRLLRQREPRLPLRPATYLVQSLAR